MIQKLLLIFANGFGSIFLQANGLMMRFLSLVKHGVKPVMSMVQLKHLKICRGGIRAANLFQMRKNKFVSSKHLISGTKMQVCKNLLYWSAM